MNLVLFVIELVHEIHHIVFDELAYPNLFRALVLRMLRHYQSELGAILRELHVRIVDSL
jgi:hypothetical protein